MTDRVLLIEDDGELADTIGVGLRQEQVRTEVLVLSDAAAGVRVTGGTQDGPFGIKIVFGPGRG